jgi:hypothetical protein
MKKLALSIATALAMTGSAVAADMAPVFKAAPEAAPDVSGYLSVYTGGTRWDSGFFETKDTAFVFGGEGRLNYWWSRGLSMQLDVETEATTSINLSGSNNWDGRVHGLIGGHWTWRDPNSHAVGFFGALTSANNLDISGQMVHGIIGLEAQKYLGNLTLYGQGGWAGRISGSDFFEPDSMWFVRFVGRYFITPNDKIQGEIGYAEGDTFNTPGEKSSILNWGASYQHRFSSTPFAISFEYAGFQHEAKNCTSFRTREDIFTVKLSMFFNERTLLFNDRNGATLDQPKFPRALPWSEVVSCVTPG